MKISKPYKKEANEVKTIRLKTKSGRNFNLQPKLSPWWEADTEDRRGMQLCETAAYLKTNQTWRIRQRAVDVRLYAGMPVYSYAGSNVSKMDQSKTLPPDMPKFNVVRSGVDTLEARIGQNKPEPKFLTDG